MTNVEPTTNTDSTTKTTTVDTTTQVATQPIIKPEPAISINQQQVQEDLTSMVHYASRRGLNIPSCLLYTSPSPRDRTRSRMPSSA